MAKLTLTSAVTRYDNVHLKEKSLHNTKTH